MTIIYNYYVSISSVYGLFEGYITYNDSNGTVIDFVDSNNVSILYTGPSPFNQGTFMSDTFDEVRVNSIGTVATGGSDGYLIATNTLLTIPGTFQQIEITTSFYCFNEGSKILCMNHQLVDEYIAIELLKIGDFVKTYKHGYRKIYKIIKGSFRNNPKKWNMCMYKMVKTDTNRLTEDLIVTGGHSILVDAISEEEQKRYDEMGIPNFSKITIDNKHLLLSCCSNQFAPMQDNNIYTYYHLLLENNDDDEERFGIWANGILTETPSKKNIS